MKINKLRNCAAFKQHFYIGLEYNINNHYRFSLKLKTHVDKVRVMAQMNLTLLNNFNRVNN